METRGVRSRPILPRGSNNSFPFWKDNITYCTTFVNPAKAMDSRDKFNPRSESISRKRELWYRSRSMANGKQGETSAAHRINGWYNSNGVYNLPVPARAWQQRVRATQCRAEEAACHHRVVVCKTFDGGNHHI